MIRWVEKRFGPNCLMSECISKWLNDLEKRAEVLDVYTIPLVTDILVLVSLDTEEEGEEEALYAFEVPVHNNVN